MFAAANQPERTGRKEGSVVGLRASDGAQGFAGNGRWIRWMRDGAFLVCDAPTTGAWCLLRLYPAGKDYIVFASRQLPEESSLSASKPPSLVFPTVHCLPTESFALLISVRYNIRYVITVPRAVCAFPHSYSIPTRVPFVELSVCIFVRQGSIALSPLALQLRGSHINTLGASTSFPRSLSYFAHLLFLFHLHSLNNSHSRVSTSFFHKKPPATHSKCLSQSSLFWPRPPLSPPKALPLPS